MIMNNVCPRPSGSEALGLRPSAHGVIGFKFDFEDGWLAAIL
jgi:hypothetical protein